jgi:hypothetical protein
MATHQLGNPEKEIDWANVGISVMGTPVAIRSMKHHAGVMVHDESKERKPFTTDDLKKVREVFEKMAVPVPLTMITLGFAIVPRYAKMKKRSRRYFQLITACKTKTPFRLSKSLSHDEKQTTIEIPIVYNEIETKSPAD